MFPGPPSPLKSHSPAEGLCTSRSRRGEFVEDLIMGNTEDHVGLKTSYIQELKVSGPWLPFSVRTGSVCGGSFCRERAGGR